MKSKFLLLSLLLSLSFVTSVFADDIKIQRVLNIGEELNCITQDKDGVIWVGVFGKGLFCYNGRVNEKAKIEGEKNPVPITWSIFTDSEGIIWFVVADHGLYSYDKKNGIYKEYKAETGNSDTLVSNHFNVCSCNDLAEDKEGLIWIGTAEGLCSYNKKTKKFARYHHNLDNPNSLSNNSVWAVFVDSEGLIWIGTEDGLNRYDKKNNSFCCYKHDPKKSNSISNSSVRAIAEDEEGNIWVGTENTGIDKFDKTTGGFTNYRHNPNNKNSLSYNGIHHLMVDRYNNLWICNDGNVGLDLYNIKTKIFTHYSYDFENLNTISSNNRLCSFKDNSGIVWLIDNSGGLSKCIWQKGIFKNYVYNPKVKSSISSNVLAKIYEDKKGNIWAGTERGGMCLYTKDGNFENFTHNETPTSLPGISVHSILDASDNKLWLGVKQGFICLFDINTRQIVKSFKNPFLNITPCYLTRDNKNPNTLWFACSYTEGVFKFNTITGEFTEYKHNPYDKSSVSNESTFGIFQHGDILWLGTGGSGLCKFNKKTGKCIYYKYNPNDKNSISGNIVIQSYIDCKGNFWVTTEDGGLNKFDTQRGVFIHYGTDCGFPSKCTRHILEDNDGYLWISTDSGIVKFDSQKAKVIKWVTTADGLSNNDFDNICSPIKDSEGNLWFSSFGLCKFNPDEASKIESNKHIPQIILSSFKSKDGTYNENGLRKLAEIKLPWPDNSFEFTFAALDYMDPEKNQYAYKLEGFDKDWKHIGTNNFGQYSNLNPGEYTLRLKGSNNDGIWNEEGLSIKITITPPFWMTSWFKTLILLAGFSILGGAVHLRIRTLKKKAIRTRDHAVAEVAAQVAHDIRSPLAALDSALKDLKGISEAKRIMIRNAARRITNISNNVLTKYKIKSKTESEEEVGPKVELVSSLLEYLVSEKQAQMSGKSINLVLELNDNARSGFTNLESEKFKRVISNLINNAAEAIESKGIIRIVLSKNNDDLIVKIIDNGKGIPENILLRIKQGEKASTKTEGHGIGISSAVESIKTWGGTYNIQSKVGEGTTFTITLPIDEEPNWFQGAITISPNTHIVVLDDDESIHGIWEMHFHECIVGQAIALEHFYDPIAFTKYCKTSRSEHDLFLVDYEMLNSNETGLDLVEHLDLRQQAILVTSRYEEEEIRKRVENLGIRIIPKNFAPYIPIFVEKEPVFVGQPDLIFIDNDKFLTDAWELQASSVNKKIVTFNRSEDFKKVMHLYDKNIPIYIDSDLKEKIPGEVFAKFLYDQGFQTIYLATGYNKCEFDNMPWIKDIVSKRLPF